MKLIIWDFRNTIYNTDTEELIPGAIEVLARYQKKFNQVLITSSNDPEERIKQIQKTGIDRYFIDIRITHKTKGIFERIIEKYNGPASEVFIIGDQYSSEIAIGNELGAKTIWLANGNPDEKKLKIKYWKRIKNLKELIEIIG